MKLFRSSQSKYSLALIALLLPLLPACGPRYQVRELKPLTHDLAHYEETKSDVLLKVRALSAEEMDYIFNGRGHYLFERKNPIYPIQVSLSNNSDQPIIIDRLFNSFPLVDTNLVAQKMRINLNALEQLAGINGIGLLSCGAGAGLFFGSWALLGSGREAGLILWIFVIPAALVAVPVLFIIGTGIFIKKNSDKAKDQRKLAVDIKNKNSLSFVVQPGQTHNFILFADGKKFQPQFNLSVVGAHEQRITFDVDLRKAIQSEFVKA